MIRSLILIACALAAVALFIATIGAVPDLSASDVMRSQANLLL